MKISFVAGLLAWFTLAVAAPVQAQTLKIGVFDVAGVISQSPQSKAVRDRLEKEFGPARIELEAMEDKIVKLKERVERDQAVMSDAERKNLERQFRADVDQLKRRTKEFQEDFQERLKVEERKIIDVLSQVVEEVATQEGYDIILRRESAPFVSERVDISDIILDALSKRGN